MQAAVAIGYDWLYHELPAEDRKSIETALLDKGLKPSFSDKSLQTRRNNWNQVCMAGMTLSAIALMDVEKKLSAKALEEARVAVKFGLKESYPADGAYSEGGGYWAYGTEFAILIVEALRSAGLPDAGIVSHPGFLESGRYIAQVYGTSGLLFNYGDTHEGTLGASVAGVWMARETQSAELREVFRPPFLKISGNKNNRFLALAAFWMPPAEGGKGDKLPLHFVGAGHSPVVFHRTGYGKEDLFIGIKAGMAKVTHGHMDAGSFVIDWGGLRWCSDLGSQNYNSLEQKGIALFDMAQKSRRWSVFRLNNFTHNTLTYNGGLHRVEGKAEIVSSKGAPENETRVDMAAPLGLPKGASATRRFQVNGGSVTVTDSFKGLKSGDRITWHIITRAAVKEREGGFGLSLGGKRMELDLASPQAVSKRAAPADPPTSDFDYPNPGMTRVFLDAVAGANGTIEIRAVFHKPSP